MRELKSDSQSLLLGPEDGSCIDHRCRCHCCGVCGRPRSVSAGPNKSGQVRRSFLHDSLLCLRERSGCGASVSVMSRKSLPEQKRKKWKKKRASRLRSGPSKKPSSLLLLSPSPAASDRGLIRGLIPCETEEGFCCGWIQEQPEPTFRVGPLDPPPHTHFPISDAIQLSHFLVDGLMRPPLHSEPLRPRWAASRASLPPSSAFFS